MSQGRAQLCPFLLFAAVGDLHSFCPVQAADGRVSTLRTGLGAQKGSHSQAAFPSSFANDS